MECGARIEVASLQNRSVINLQHPPCGPSISTILRELDMLRYRCATAALGADVMPLLALSGGTAQGHFLRVRLHSSASEPGAVVHIDTLPAL